jgi:hypothetical protein
VLEPGPVRSPLSSPASNRERGEVKAAAKCDALSVRAFALRSKTTRREQQPLA